MDYFRCFCMYYFRCFQMLSNVEPVYTLTACFLTLLPRVNIIGLFPSLIAEKYLMMAFICFLLIVGEAGHFFVCLLAIEFLWIICLCSLSVFILASCSLSFPPFFWNQFVRALWILFINICVTSIWLCLSSFVFVFICYTKNILNLW